MERRIGGSVSALINFDPTRRLSDEDMFRGAILALRLWANEGKFTPQWQEYRDSAVAWLEASAQRLRAITAEVS
jgi:hypothetical protein